MSNQNNSLLEEKFNSFSWPFDESEILKDTELLGCILERTSIACPEQYDVMLNGEMIGYLRLRHGCFTASYPDWDGKLVYSDTEVIGDGMFASSERETQLTKAVTALLAEHNKPKE